MSLTAPRVSKVEGRNELWILVTLHDVEVFVPVGIDLRRKLCSVFVTHGKHCNIARGEVKKHHKVPMSMKSSRERSGEVHVNHSISPPVVSLVFLAHR